MSISVPICRGDKDFYCRVEKNGPRPGLLDGQQEPADWGIALFFIRHQRSLGEGFGSGETYFIYIISTQYTIDRFKLVEIKQKLNKMGQRPFGMMFWKVSWVFVCLFCFACKS